jgi:hypothetical protein
MRAVAGRPGYEWSSRYPDESARNCTRRLYRLIHFTDLNADARKQSAHIVDAAGLEIGFQFIAERLRYGGIGRQAGIGPVVAGENR